MSTRLAAGLVAAALLCACSGPKAASGPGPTPAPSSLAAASGPANAAAARAGTAGAVALNADQRSELAAVVARQPRDVRARLRYALAVGEDGKTRLVVYDGEGLAPDGRHPGKPREYVVFKILNSRTGEHYDPQQNSVVAPIPPPVQREAPIKR
jgi:hypothetical protein